MSDDLPRAGDWLICENGHRAYKCLAEQVPRGPIPSDEWIDANGNHPEQYGLMECPTCGGHLAKRNPENGRLVPIQIERATQ